MWSSMNNAIMHARTIVARRRQAVRCAVDRLIDKRTLRDGASMLFDQSFYSLLSFLASVMLARALTPHAYGIYVFVMSLIAPMFGIQRALVSTPYTIRSKHYRRRRLHVYAGSVLVHEIFFVCGSALVLALVLRYTFPDAMRSIAFPAVTLAACGLLFRDFVRFLLLASLEIRKTILTGIVVNATQLVLFALLFITERLTLLNALLLVGGCSLLPAVMTIATYRRFRFNLSAVIHDLLDNLKIGKWMLGGSVAAALGSQIYIWLLVLLADARSVAALGVTASLANLLSPLLQGASAFLLPKMVQSRSAGGTPAMIRITKKAIMVLTCVFALWLALGVLFGERLLSLLYSTKYSGYGGVFILLMLHVLLSALMVPINAALDALERSDISFRSAVAGLVTSVTVGTIAVYSFGLYGAAATALLSNAVNLVGRWRGLMVLTKKSLPQIQ